MGNTYYVDTAGSNTSPYDTWEKAANALATVVAIPPAATDIIYCRGGETIAAEIDIASSGTYDGGFIKVIGCNAAGNVDGTRHVINCNNNGINGIDLAGYDLWWFENIEVKNTGGSGKYGFYTNTSSALGIIFINCCANNCSSHGFYIPNIVSKGFRCISYGNGGAGYYRGDWFFCAARDNTDSGFNLLATGTICFGCISHGNGDDGFEAVDGTFNLINCVADGNADDGIERESSTDLSTLLLLGCRVTNQSGAGDIGLNCNSRLVITGWCYFEDNDGDNIQNATLHYFIPSEGGSTTSNLEDLANTGEGYTDKASHDFSTRYVDAGDPDLRRVAITVPWS